jgi:type I restriction enzyme S subunit
MEMKKYKLGEYLDSFGDGIHGTPKYDEYGDYYFINGNNLNDGKIEITSKTLKVSANEYEKIKRNLNEKSLLVSINGTLGNIAFYNGERIALGKSACFLNLKESSCREYLRYVLETKEFKSYMNRVAGQSTIKNVSPTQISEFEFYAPPLSTQQKIAAVLSSLDDKIALNKKINAKLEAMAKRLYDYWFVQFDFSNGEGKPYKTSGGKMVWNEVLKREIPEGWEVKSVFEASDVLYGYPYATEPFDEDNLELSKKPYKVVRIRDIQNNSFSAKTTEVVDEKYKTKQNDLLVGMDGYFHMNFWFSNNDYINQRIVRFRKTLISTLILNFQIKPFIKFKETMAKGSTVGHLSDKDLKQLFIAIPNDNSISDRFDSILNMITKNNSEIQKLTELRDRLLPLLMTGQVISN